MDEQSETTTRSTSAGLPPMAANGEAGIDPATVSTETRVGRVGRENIATKGRRYLIEGRLTIRYVGVNRIAAHCRGTEETHTLGFDEDWACSCPAKGRCSHLVALQLVAPRLAPPCRWEDR